MRACYHRTVVPSVVSYERVCDSTCQNVMSMTDEECSVKFVGSDTSCFRLYSNISSLILLLLFWDMSMLKSPVMTTSAMFVLHALSTLSLINSK